MTAYADCPDARWMFEWYVAQEYERRDALGEQVLTVYLSLNYLAERQLELGALLPLRLLPERMRVFG